MRLHFLILLLSFIIISCSDEEFPPSVDLTSSYIGEYSGIHKNLSNPHQIVEWEDVCTINKITNNILSLSFQAENLPYHSVRLSEPLSQSIDYYVEDTLNIYHGGIIIDVVEGKVLFKNDSLFFDYGFRNKDADKAIRQYSFKGVRNN